MLKNYIFTITNGRSGQETLYRILQKYAINCFSDFEAPNIKTLMPSPLNVIERKIRRKFIETDELLGRGKVIQAYENKDFKFIENIARKRLVFIEEQMHKLKADSYFDISKFYVRGLFEGFNRLVKAYSLVFLVRDPLQNMKSFYNRNKNFYLDNSVPSAKTNILQLNHECLSKEELYLWAWSEVFLRFKRLSKSNRVLKSIVFKTEDLKSPKRVETLFKSLNIKYNAIKDVKIINTNQEIGLRKTKVLEEDLEKLVKFIKKLPKDKIELKKHLKSSLQKNNLILKKFNI
tara:strand:- start:3029 stop:3898 length:870 start_codon:yes stop_codon:yes gene_type:complete